MSHASTLERPAETAETPRLDPGTLLILLILVVYLLLDDHLNGRLGAALRGAGDETDEKTTDGVAPGRCADRPSGDTGRSPSNRGKTGQSEPAVKSPGPLSPLGEELVKIREEIVASGEPLLSWEDLEREVAERRGEVA